MKRKTDANKKSKKTKKAWRFYRSNLSTIVWNPNTDSALADFSEGHFTTQDKKVANILKAKGYPEIGLEDESPPDIIVNQPAQVLKDGQNIPIMGPGTNPNVLNAQINKVTEQVTPPAVR